MSPTKLGCKFWDIVALQLCDSLGEKPAALLLARFYPHRGQEPKAGRIGAAPLRKPCCSAAPAALQPLPPSIRGQSKDWSKGLKFAFCRVRELFRRLTGLWGRCFGLAWTQRVAQKSNTVCFKTSCTAKQTAHLSFFYLYISLRETVGICNLSLPSLI